MMPDSTPTTTSAQKQSYSPDNVRDSRPGSPFTVRLPTLLRNLMLTRRGKQATPSKAYLRTKSTAAGTSPYARGLRSYFRMETCHPSLNLQARFVITVKLVALRLNFSGAFISRGTPESSRSLMLDNVRQISIFSIRRSARCG